MMHRINKRNGLRISVLVAVFVALLLCFTLGVAADEETELEIDIAKLNFAGTGITVDGETGDYVKTYDGTAAGLALPTLTAQPAAIAAGDDATVSVASLTFGSADAGNTTMTVKFTVTGEDKDKYVVKDLAVAAKILPKTLTWAGNAALNVNFTPGSTSYTGYIAKADLPGFTEAVGDVFADAQVTVNFSAPKAGDYVVQATVNLNSNNYSVGLLTVNATVKKIELTKVEWSGTTVQYGENVSPVLTAYDAANTAYSVVTFEAPAAFNGAVGTYNFTAKLLDADNYSLANAAIGKTQTITVNPVTYTVSFTSQTLITDGKTPNMITVVGDLPAEVRALITYTVGGTAFTGAVDAGAYEITATLPGANYAFRNELGQEVTALTATMTVKTDVIEVAVEGGDTILLLKGNDGLSKDTAATAKKAEPEKLPEKAKNYEAVTVKVSGTEGATYTVFLPISSSLFGKRYDAVDAASVYVYVNGAPVQATNKGYTVTVNDGYVKIVGLANGEATFVIAPVYHAPFFLTALGIAIIILLVILLLIILFLIGLYVRRVLESGRTLTTVIDTEGTAPEEKPAEEPAEEPVEEPEEEPVEEPAEETATDEDSLAAAVAAAFEEATEEEEVPAVQALADVAEDEEAMVGEDGIVFIDTKENPEEYQKMLDQEAAGEGQVIYRFKRTFLSRLAQSQGSVQDYYNGIKNALLSYKGVKSRVSSGYDAFNKGRIKVAKINSKVKTLYVYLAIDPESIKDTKYNAVDVSDKKKFAATPVLMKIRGDRKFKYTLELIEALCAGQLECKKLEKEPEDFRVPYATTDELVESGLIRKFAGLAPLSYTPTFGGEPDDEPEEDLNDEENEEVAADANATDASSDTNA